MILNCLIINLKRLPVPSLESSIQRYLVAVKPHLNNEEFENTQKLALDFIKKDGIGEKLQKLLVEKSKKTDNWVKTKKNILNFSPFYINLRSYFILVESMVA